MIPISPLPAKGASGVLIVGTCCGDEVMWVSRSFENTELLRWPTHVALALNSNSDEFSLIPGKKVQLVISVYTNHDTPDWKNKAITEAEKVTEAGVEQLRKEHHS